MRVVLDTNVIVSALLFERGQLTWVRDAWSVGRIRPLIDAPCLDELLRVLTYPKFRLSEDGIRALLGSFLPYTKTIEQRGRVAGLPRCRDADDRKFLALAARGDAEVLVTGDAALLALDGRTSFAIERPSDLRSRMGE